MSSVHELVSAPPADRIVDGSEVPLIRGRPSPDGQLNLDEVQPFDEVLNPGVYGRHVLLSLADITSIGTPCIGWLLAVHQRFCQRGGKLVVHSIRPQAMGILHFLGLDRVLHVAEDEAAALQLLRAGENVPEEY